MIAESRTPRPAQAARCLAALAVLMPGQACPGAPLEAYGQLPSLDHVCLSPDGTRVAFVTELKAQRVILVRSIYDGAPIKSQTEEALMKSVADGALLDGLRLRDPKLRSLKWADDDHLLITVNELGRDRGRRRA